GTPAEMRPDDVRFPRRHTILQAAERHHGDVHAIRRITGDDV
ncbi:MAG: hypothetical protein AVDCRST_MAG87-1435, partial [uncultured Thermomicrobiales bacterium]